MIKQKEKSAREIAVEEIRSHPELQTRTLARRLVSIYPGFFESIDSARDLVRRVRGAHGVKNIKYAVPELVREHGKAGETLRFPDAVRPIDHSPYILSGGKIGIISDLHIPWHDQDAILCALEYLEEKDVDHILINGDLIDFYQCSRFTKNPLYPHTSEEIKRAGEFLVYLRGRFPDTEITWKLGNHEERFEIYLMEKAPEFYEMFKNSLTDLLDLDELGIALVKDGRVCKAGALNIVHGHERRQGFAAPVNPARGIFLWAKESTLAGHSHQISEHSEPNLSRQQYSCWSTGCLCDLQPDYDRFNKWSHGFAYVEVGERGSFKVKNHRIMNGEIY